MLKKLDARLATLKTDYIDLLFFHGLDTNQTDWPKSKELKETIEAIKKTGKVKFVGFSTHDAMIAEQIQNAADGGFVDVIMLKFNPVAGEGLRRSTRPSTPATPRNIGLVSMKQIAGQALKITEERVPSLKAKGLTPPRASSRRSGPTSGSRPRA